MRFSYERVVASHGSAVADAAYELNALFDERVYLWMAGLWDSERGGFYYANSSRDEERFLPDLESTGQALGHFEMLGLVDSYSDLPVTACEKLYNFVASMQDPEDGYFYHPQWGKNVNSSRRGRDLGHAVGILRELGRKALYPTATERLSANRDNTVVNEASSYLSSEVAFRRYLCELDIRSDSYGKGHILSAIAAEIRAAGLAEVCEEYLNSTQYAETGLWSETKSYLSLSGLLKISGTYRLLGKEFPNMERALRSAIEIALSEEPTPCTVQVYNPICSVQNLFEIAAKTGNSKLTAEARLILSENAERLLRCTAEKLAKFKRDDGAFSYLDRGSTPISQKVEVSLGLVESDMNATALCDSSRKRCMDIIGLNVDKLCEDKDREILYSIVK